MNESAMGLLKEIALPLVEEKITELEMVLKDPRHDVMIDADLAASIRFYKTAKTKIQELCN